MLEELKQKNIIDLIIAQALDNETLLKSFECITSHKKSLKAALAVFPNTYFHNNYKNRELISIVNTFTTDNTSKPYKTLKDKFNYSLKKLIEKENYLIKRIAEIKKSIDTNKLIKTTSFEKFTDLNEIIKRIYNNNENIQESEYNLLFKFLILEISRSNLELFLQKKYHSIDVVTAEDPYCYIEVEKKDNNTVKKEFFIQTGTNKTHTDPNFTLNKGTQKFISQFRVNPNGMDAFTALQKQLPYLFENDLISKTGLELLANKIIDVYFLYSLKSCNKDKSAWDIFNESFEPGANKKYLRNLSLEYCYAEIVRAFYNFPIDKLKSNYFKKEDLSEYSCFQKNWKKKINLEKSPLNIVDSLIFINKFIPLDNESFFEEGCKPLQDPKLVEKFHFCKISVAESTSLAKKSTEECKFSDLFLTEFVLSTGKKLWVPIKKIITGNTSDNNLCSWTAFFPKELKQQIPNSLYIGSNTITPMYLSIKEDWNVAVFAQLFDLCIKKQKTDDIINAYTEIPGFVSNLHMQALLLPPNAFSEPLNYFIENYLSQLNLVNNEKYKKFFSNSLTKYFIDEKNNIASIERAINLFKAVRCSKEKAWTAKFENTNFNAQSLLLILINTHNTNTLELNINKFLTEKENDADFYNFIENNIIINKVKLISKDKKINLDQNSPLLKLHQIAKRNQFLQASKLIKSEYIKNWNGLEITNILLKKINNLVNEGVSQLNKAINSEFDTEIKYNEFIRDYIQNKSKYFDLEINENSNVMHKLCLASQMGEQYIDALLNSAKKENAQQLLVDLTGNIYAKASLVKAFCSGFKDVCVATDKLNQINLLLPNETFTPEDFQAFETLLKKLNQQAYASKLTLVFYNIKNFLDKDDKHALTKLFKVLKNNLSEIQLELPELDEKKLYLDNDKDNLRSIHGAYKTIQNEVQKRRQAKYIPHLEKSSEILKQTSQIKYNEPKENKLLFLGNKSWPLAANISIQNQQTLANNTSVTTEHMSEQQQKAQNDIKNALKKQQQQQQQKKSNNYQGKTENLVTYDTIAAYFEKHWAQLPKALKMQFSSAQNAVKVADIDAKAKQFFSFWFGYRADNANAIHAVSYQVLQQVIKHWKDFNYGLPEDSKNWPQAFCLTEKNINNRSITGMILCLNTEVEISSDELNKLKNENINPLQMSLHCAWKANNHRIGNHYLIGKKDTALNLLLQKKLGLEPSEIKGTKAILPEAKSDIDATLLLQEYENSSQIELDLLNDFDLSAKLKSEFSTLSNVSEICHHLSDENFKVLGQAVQKYGIKSLELLFSLMQFIYTHLGEGIFLKWKKFFLDPIQNASELLEEVQLEAIQDYIKVLNQNSFSNYNKIFWALLEKHHACIGYQHFAKQWYAFKALVEYLNKQDLLIDEKQLEIFLNKQTKFNSVVFIERLISLLASRECKAEKELIINHLSDLELRFNQDWNIALTKEKRNLVSYFSDWQFHAKNVALRFCKDKEQYQDYLDCFDRIDKFEINNNPDETKSRLAQLVIMGTQHGQIDIKNINDKLLQQYKDDFLDTNFNSFADKLIKAYASIKNNSEKNFWSFSFMDSLIYFQATIKAEKLYDARCFTAEFITDISRLLLFYSQPVNEQKNSWRLIIKETVISLLYGDRSEAQKKLKSFFDFIKDLSSKGIYFDSPLILILGYLFAPDYNNAQLAGEINQSYCDAREKYQTVTDKLVRQLKSFRFEQSKSIFAPALVQEVFDNVFRADSEINADEFRKNFITKLLEDSYVIEDQCAIYQSLKAEKIAEFKKALNPAKLDDDAMACIRLKPFLFENKLAAIQTFLGDYVVIDPNTINATLYKAQELFLLIDKYDQDAALVRSLDAFNNTMHTLAEEKASYRLSFPLFLEYLETFLPQQANEYYPFHFMQWIIEAEAKQGSALVHYDHQHFGARVNPAYLTVLQKLLQQYQQGILNPDQTKQLLSIAVAFKDKGLDYFTKSLDFLAKLPAEPKELKQALVKLIVERAREANYEPNALKIQIKWFETIQTQVLNNKWIDTLNIELSGDQKTRLKQHFLRYLAKDENKLKNITCEAKENNQFFYLAAAILEISLETHSEEIITLLAEKLKKLDSTNLSVLATYYLENSHLPSLGKLLENENNDISARLHQFEAHGFNNEKDPIRKFYYTESDKKILNTLFLNFNIKGQGALELRELLPLIRKLTSGDQYNLVGTSAEGKPLAKEPLAKDPLAEVPTGSLIEQSLHLAKALREKNSIANDLRTDDMEKLVAIVCEVFLRKFDKKAKWLKPTQILAVLALLSQKENKEAQEAARRLMLQMPTGEGKSAVFCLLSVLFALLGRSTLVLSSKDELVKRDYEKFFAMYKTFGISSSCLNKDSPEESLPISNNGVGGIVHATPANYQLYRMKCVWENSNPSTDPNAWEPSKITLLGDEGDFILQNQNLVFNFSVSDQENGTLINQDSLIYQTVLNCVDENKSNLLQTGQFNTELVNLVAERILKIKDNLPERSCFIKKYLTPAVGEDNKAEAKLIELIQAAWAVLNRKINKGQEYTTIPYSLFIGGETLELLRIVPLSDQQMQTGADFSGELSPMLATYLNRLAEKEGRTANYFIPPVSNVVLIQTASNIKSSYAIWATATAGNGADRADCKVEVIKLSPLNGNNTEQKQSIFAKGEDCQINKIVKAIQLANSDGYSTLVQCADEIKSEEIGKKLQTHLGREFNVVIHTNTSNESIFNKPLPLNTVVLSSLAKRGTDVAVANDAKGLNVILTSLENRKEDKQREGRQGRGGQPGRVQYILNKKTLEESYAYYEKYLSTNLAKYPALLQQIDTYIKQKLETRFSGQDGKPSLDLNTRELQLKIIYVEFVKPIVDGYIKQPEKKKQDTCKEFDSAIINYKKLTNDIKEKQEEFSAYRERLWIELQGENASSNKTPDQFFLNWRDAVSKNAKEFVPIINLNLSPLKTLEDMVQERLKFEQSKLKKHVHSESEINIIKAYISLNCEVTKQCKERNDSNNTLSLDDLHQQLEKLEQILTNNALKNTQKIQLLKNLIQLLPYVGLTELNEWLSALNESDKFTSYYNSLDLLLKHDYWKFKNNFQSGILISEYIRKFTELGKSELIIHFLDSLTLIKEVEITSKYLPMADFVFFDKNLQWLRKNLISQGYLKDLLGTNKENLFNNHEKLLAIWKTDEAQRYAQGEGGAVEEEKINGLVPGRIKLITEWCLNSSDTVDTIKSKIQQLLTLHPFISSEQSKLIAEESLTCSLVEDTAAALQNYFAVFRNNNLSSNEDKALRNKNAQKITKALTPEEREIIDLFKSQTDSTRLEQFKFLFTQAESLDRVDLLELTRVCVDHQFKATDIMESHITALINIVTNRWSVFTAGDINYLVQANKDKLNKKISEENTFDQLVSGLQSDFELLNHTKDCFEGYKNNFSNGNISGTIGTNWTNTLDDTLGKIELSFKEISIEDLLKLLACAGATINITDEKEKIKQGFTAFYGIQPNLFKTLIKNYKTLVSNNNTKEKTQQGNGLINNFLQNFQRFNSTIKENYFNQFSQKAYEYLQEDFASKDVDIELIKNLHNSTLEGYVVNSINKRSYIGLNELISKDLLMDKDKQLTKLPTYYSQAISKLVEQLPSQKGQEHKKKSPNLFKQATDLINNWSQLLKSRDEKNNQNIKFIYEEKKEGKKELVDSMIKNLEAYYKPIFTTVNWTRRGQAKCLINALKKLNSTDDNFYQLVLGALSKAAKEVFDNDKLNNNKQGSRFVTLIIKSMLQTTAMAIDDQEANKKLLFFVEKLAELSTDAANAKAVFNKANGNTNQAHVKFLGFFAARNDSTIDAVQSKNKHQVNLIK